MICDTKRDFNELTIGERYRVMSTFLMLARRSTQQHSEHYQYHRSPDGYAHDIGECEPWLKTIRQKGNCERYIVGSCLFTVRDLDLD